MLCTETERPEGQEQGKGKGRRDKAPPITLALSIEPGTATSGLRASLAL
jgi:hypothetical protein